VKVMVMTTGSGNQSRVFYRWQRISPDNPVVYGERCLQSDNARRSRESSHVTSCLSLRGLAKEINRRRPVHY